MRRYDKVIALKQRAGERVISSKAAACKLILQNVCCITADRSGLQSFIHILLINDTAAAHVEDNSVILHSGDGFCIEQIFCIWCQRYMDRYEIRNLQQFFDGHACSILFLKVFRFQEWIVSYNGHAECASQLAHTAADTSESHYAKSFSAKFTAYELIFIPLMFYLNIIVCCKGSAGDIKHLRKSQLCNCICIHAGCVKDLNSFLFCILSIDVV